MSTIATRVSGGVLPHSATGLGSCQAITWFSKRHPSQAAAGSAVIDAPESAGMRRTLAPHEILFKEGEARSHVYRIESGTVCVYEPHQNGKRSVIEFAVPGDLIGFGYLRSHTQTARATTQAQVTCLPLSAIDDVVKDDPRAEAKLEEAVERDFRILRNSLVKSARVKPVARVAAFLVTLSQGNKREGRDPSIISDSLKCGVVADYLSLSIELLSSILVALEERGLIEHCPPLGLRLKDTGALEKLASGFEVGGADVSDGVRCSP
jgi:CRP/FNR family transcriptional regulator